MSGFINFYNWDIILWAPYIIFDMLKILHFGGIFSVPYETFLQSNSNNQLQNYEC